MYCPPIVLWSSFFSQLSEILLFFDIVEGTGIRRVAEVFADPEVDADQAEQVRSFRPGQTST
jgi:hypothetical protein